MFSLTRVCFVSIELLVICICFWGGQKLSWAIDNDYFPPPESAGGWRTLTNDDELRRLGNVDPAKIHALKAWLLKSDNRDFAAVVICNGHIVLEVERGNSSKTDARRVASVSKAVCATVLAIASERSQQGRTPQRMTFDDKAFTFIPWANPLSDPRKADITVKQLLNHTSGITPEASGAKNDGSWEYLLGHSGDLRTSQLAFAPGTACGYSSHALCHASLVCESVTGKPYDQFAIESLFQPIGCEHWWFQYYEGGEKIGRHPSHGLGMPARDLARVAYCMLRNGRWKNQQELPALSKEDVHGIPTDARYKPGSGGQVIAFVPSLDMVITRQTGQSGNWEYEEFVRQACAASLSMPPSMR